MKDKLNNLTIILVVFGIFAATITVILINSFLGDSVNETAKISTISQAQINEGKRIIDINVTWGDFLDSYMKENPQEVYYKPRQDLSKDHKVRVIKTEYPNGHECKSGFYSYALITEVFDLKTGELLSSVGNYKKTIN